MSIAASLSAALAVFAGVVAAVLALAVYPPAESTGKRVLGLLVIAALVLLWAISLMTGHG